MCKLQTYASKVDSQYIKINTNLIIVCKSFPEDSWRLLPGDAVTRRDNKNKADLRQFWTETAFLT